MSIAGTKRIGRVSRHSRPFPAPGMPSEQGFGSGSVRRGATGPSAFVIPELFPSRLGRRAGSGARQLAPSCSLSSPCFPLLPLALKEPALVWFALTLPVPLGPLGGGGLHPHPIGCLRAMHSRSALRLQSTPPKPFPDRFMSFPSCHRDLPAAAGASALPMLGPCPLRTRILARGSLVSAGPALGFPCGSHGPGAIGSAPESRSMLERAGSPPSLEQDRDKPLLPPFALLPLALDTSFGAVSDEAKINLSRRCRQRSSDRERVKQSLSQRSRNAGRWVIYSSLLHVLGSDKAPS